jgi:hypothetical protein
MYSAEPISGMYLSSKVGFIPTSPEHVNDIAQEYVGGRGKGPVFRLVQ